MEAHLYSRSLCVVDIRFGSPLCCKKRLCWDLAHSVGVHIKTQKAKEMIVIHKSDVKL